MAKVRLANPYDAVSLQYNFYQASFMQARRMRVCENSHEWSCLVGERAYRECPTCGAQGFRPYRRFILRAGRRGGKTRMGTLSVVEELTIPNVWWWVSAPVYRDLEDFVMPAFFAQLPQAWLSHPRTEWSESNYRLILPNRAKVEFRSLEDPESARGPGVDGWYIDEICKVTKKHWEVGAPMLADRRGILIGTTTPRGEDWVDEVFCQPAQRGVPGFWFCSYPSREAPIFASPEGQAELEEQRLTMTPLMYRQEYDADLVTFEGAVYGDLVDRCVIEGTDEEMRAYFPEWPAIDPARPAITGLDPGTDHPFAGVHLVQSPRGLVGVGEYLQRRQMFKVHSDKIREMRGGSIGRIAIDRSQAQAQIELAQYGLFTVAADNDVTAGINRVSAWMLKNPEDRGDRLPSGLVLPRRYVPELIRTLRKYRWADSEKKDGSLKNREIVYKKDDDLPDALRYALMLYPVLPAADPVTLTGKRDLSTLPDHVRTEIERLRKHESAGAADEENDEGLVSQGVGEFYGMQ